MFKTRGDGFGAFASWGSSPALDLIPLYEQGRSQMLSDGRAESLLSSSTVADCVRILLVGCGDLRHLLATIAGVRSSRKPVHFYMVENCLEIFARHMLFLGLLCEPSSVVGLQEKAEMFLELYGNTLLRARTSDYLRSKSKQLIRMITDDEYSKICLPLLDISLLKFKERDFLEKIFEFWNSLEDNTFDITHHWDDRLRQYLGVRYDTRNGVYDWDYHMKLQELAPNVSYQEYTKWRETGVAFHLREDAPYEIANKTLTFRLLAKQDGGMVATRGYWGDIVNSPYLSFGVQSKCQDLFNGKTTSQSSTQISNVNVISLIHQLTKGEDCTSAGVAAIPGPNASLTHQSDSKDSCLSKEGALAEVEDFAESLNGPLLNGSCSVTLLPVGCLPQLCKKDKYKKVFNIAYFSNSMVHHLTTGVETTFAPDCTLVLETARFMLDLNKEHKSQYKEKIASIAGAIGFKIPLAFGDGSVQAHRAFI